MNSYLDGVEGTDRITHYHDGFYLYSLYTYFRFVYMRTFVQIYGNVYTCICKLFPRIIREMLTKHRLVLIRVVYHQMCASIAHPIQVGSSTIGLFIYRMLYYVFYTGNKLHTSQKV